MKTPLLLFLIPTFAAGWLGASLQEARSEDHAGFAWKELVEAAEAGDFTYYPFLERPSLMAGLYRLPAGGTDRQSPHELDEVYYVARGRSGFTAGGVQYEVEPGTVLFVAAGVPHSFHDIAEDLEVLVLFSKAREDED